MNKCNKFVLNNFDIISQSTGFENLSKEKLSTYMSEECLKTEKGEIEVFRAALKWYEASRNEGDSSDLVDLMQHIRFPLIPSNLLLNEILACRLISENPEVMKMATEALQFQSSDNIFLQPLPEGKQFRPRGEKMLALIDSKYKLEGQRFVEVETKLRMIKDFDNRSFQTQFSKQPLTTAFHPGGIYVVTKGNYLFLFGTDVEYLRAVAMRFDVRKNTWLDLKLLPQRASVRMAVTLLKNNIYLLGGMHLIKDSENTIDRSNFSESVSQYSIETNSWSKLEKLPKPLAYHSAAAHGDYVFCAGGYTQDATYTDKLYAYDVVGKIWLTKPSMKEKRGRFSLEAVGAKLVACGGKLTSSVEIYDIAEDQWTLIQDEALVNHLSPATFVLNDRVYVIGGSIKNEDGTYSPTDYVSIVDVDNRTVRKGSSLPFRVTGHACALLTVPSVTTKGDTSQN